MRDTVARVRRLLEEAAEVRPPQTTESRAAQAFNVHQVNCAQRHPTEQTHRARAQREIERIANWYGWISELDRAMDAARVSSPAAMSDEQLDALLARMRQLEDCVQNGIDPPDAPPAR